MEPAWYEHGINEPIPALKVLSNNFLIVVDPNFKATNFISFEEDYLRHQSINRDTNDLKLNYFEENWDKLSIKKRLKMLDSTKLANKLEADSVHLINNQGKNQVWVINNTSDTVSIQMQDWSFICILQGLTKSGRWLPLQYWRFSGCGNSYHHKQFAPKTANSFLFTIPNKGDYQTKLRFKILGVDQFYYSNEFTGKIDYCEFVEDSSNHTPDQSPPPHYKLDSIIQLPNY